MSTTVYEDLQPPPKRRRFCFPVSSLALADIATSTKSEPFPDSHGHYHSNGHWYKGTAKEDRLVPEKDESLKRMNIIKAWILRNCGRFPSVGTIASQLRYRPGILGPQYTVERAVAELCAEGLLRREGGRVMSLVTGIECPRPTPRWRPPGIPQVTDSEAGSIVEAGGLCAIDRLVGHGVREGDGAVFYLVQWLGQPRAAATWEPEAALIATAAPVVLHYRKSLTATSDGGT
eukprot:EG_transcript_23016